MTSRRAVGLVAIIIIALMILIACGQREEDPAVTDYQTSMNSDIVEYCGLFRSSDAQSRERIRDYVQEMIEGYSGRIDTHAEYCLNSMEIER